MNNIVIFASGSGSNAENIIRFFNTPSPKNARVAMLFANKPDIYAIERAAKLGVSSRVFSRNELHSGAVLHELEQQNAALIVLAGFLWLMPESIIRAFPRRIINIHPALLPKYGGKGMYGMNVHRAVKAAGEQETGITVHYVNEEYDSGSTIFQAKCRVDEGDTPEQIAGKIHALEQEHFPRVIEQVAGSLPSA